MTTDADMQFQDKFIAFIDVLGFKRLVERAEASDGVTVEQILEIQKKLASPQDREHFSRYGPTTCPQAPFIRRDLDFRITQVSDSSIASAEVSPAGLINLVGTCWDVVVELLYMGLMCRGYVTRGTILHTGDRFIGTGFHAASEQEKHVTFRADGEEVGTPYVGIDPGVVRYADTCEDPCVREMFSRMVERLEDSVALFPFKRLSHSFIVAGFGIEFDANREKVSNDTIRRELHALRERVMSFVNMADEKAVRKGHHYVAAIENQLRVCDRTDEMIDRLQEPIPRSRWKPT